MSRQQAAAAPEAAGLLAVRDVAVAFGAVTALDGVSFSMAAGEICGLIGPNGSGKTTLFNCISGFCRPQRGAVLLRGQDITRLGAHRRAALGVGRTIQTPALFPGMSVRDNILVGAHPRGRFGLLAHALGLPAARRDAAAAERRLQDLLTLLELRDVAGHGAGALALGTARRVEIARALMGGPRLLLLDEPAGGLNHAEVAALLDLLGALRARFRLGILLVEHHMGLVMRACSHVVALAAGSMLADGTPQEVQRSPSVVAAYLGAVPVGAHAA
jgi:branched-chain amino acid transport system ATP-binding protein